MRVLIILALAIDALISAAAADPNCICRAGGQEFELGQSTCLASPKGPRIATCGMVLNNTSWQFTDTPCVISKAPAGATGQLIALAGRGGGATVPGLLRAAP
jgi:hypothetical protein